MEEERKVLRSSNISSKYELIIVAAREARRLNELSRQTGLNLGGKVTNVALEECLKGDVQYYYLDAMNPARTESAPIAPAAGEEEE